MDEREDRAATNKLPRISLDPQPPFILKRVVNPALSALGAGTILIARGRRSGRTYAVPVNLLTFGDLQYLVASWGMTDWARNLLANPDAELQQGRRSRRIRAVPISDADKPPLIEAYLKAWGWRPGVRRQFQRLPHPKDHPIFRLEQAHEVTAECPQ